MEPGPILPTAGWGFLCLKAKIRLEITLESFHITNGTVLVLFTFCLLAALVFALIGKISTSGACISD